MPSASEAAAVNVVPATKSLPLMAIEPRVLFPISTWSSPPQPTKAVATITGNNAFLNMLSTPENLIL